MKRKSTRPHRMMENLFRPLNPPQTSRNHLKNKNTGVTSALSDSRTLKSFKQVTLFNCVSPVERSQGLHITGQLSEHKRAGYSSWRPENTEERSRNSLSPSLGSASELSGSILSTEWTRARAHLSRTLTRARTGDERWARSCILTRGGRARAYLLTRGGRARAYLLTRGGRAREHWQGRALVTRGGRARAYWREVGALANTDKGALAHTGDERWARSRTLTRARSRTLMINGVDGLYTLRSSRETGS